MIIIYMNPEKSINIAGSVIIFFILLFVFAKWGPAINFSTTSQSKGEPFVVNGEGKVSVVPDVAKVTFGIQENGGSLKQVQDSVNTKSKSLTNAIKKLGIAESDIKTTSYNVYPQYDYINPGQRITGYQVSTNYQVTVKDFDKVNDLIVLATDAGANIVGGVSFELSDSTKAEKTNEARVKAVADAKTKAEGLANAAGISLVKIINVSESQNGISPRFYAMPASGDSLEQKSIAQPDIQPGQTEIQVIISLSYEIR
ncbi:MAG: SIMPL domain-containing protein [Candidatus Woesebacteria bacterium]|nr:MAG: SIMPL domain-containing protein [Candidatus Woesebacteria bacterium]